MQGWSENGWVNIVLFIEYIKYFAGHTIYSKNSPVLVVFDGHETPTKRIKVDYKLLSAAVRTDY